MDHVSVSYRRAKIGEYEQEYVQRTGKLKRWIKTRN